MIRDASTRRQDSALVERGHNGPPPRFPHLPIGRNEALAHDKLQDLAQDAL